VKPTCHPLRSLVAVENSVIVRDREGEGPAIIVVPSTKVALLNSIYKFLVNKLGKYFRFLNTYFLF